MTCLFISSHKNVSSVNLEIINNFTKVSGYNVSLWTSTTFLCTTYEYDEEVITLIYNGLTAMTYPGINITKEVKSSTLKTFKSEQMKTSHAYGLK